MRESQVEAHLVKRAKALGFMVRKVKFLGLPLAAAGFETYRYKKD